jgi:branched-chain amino acid transport system ATP-binding protein
VRRLASAVLVASCAAGIALRVVEHGRDPATAIWLAAGAIAIAVAGAAVGHRRPRPVAAASVGSMASLVAVVQPTALLAVFAAAGYVLGSALRSAGDTVVHPLAHASRGWITIQVLPGIAIGALLLGGPRPGLALIVVSAAAIAVAVNAVWRPAVVSDPRPVSNAALSVVDAGVTIGGTDILRGADLQVAPGEIVGVVGTNGVGKTTLLRAISGEVRLDGGAVFVRHTDVTVLAPEERFALGLMLSDADDGSNGELTVRENLRLLARSSHDRSSYADVIGAVGGLHRSLTDRLDDRAAVLSGGERRILALAQIAIAQPSVLLVDELARGLSAGAMEMYRSLLRGLAERGSAVVVVDHDVRSLRAIAHRVVRLSDGRLAPEEEPSTVPPFVPSGAGR